MSDEPYDVALGVLRGFTMGEEVGSQALAVIESQNQALQERAEKAEAALRRIEDIARPGCAGVHGYEFAAIVREARALSPTQETDPE